MSTITVQNLTLSRAEAEKLRADLESALTPKAIRGWALIAPFCRTPDNYICGTNLTAEEPNSEGGFCIFIDHRGPKSNGLSPAMLAEGWKLMPVMMTPDKRFISEGWDTD